MFVKLKSKLFVKNATRKKLKYFLFYPSYDTDFFFKQKTL